MTGELLATLTPDDKPNSYYLSDEGIEQLHSWLDSGCYRVRYPEHGALLMVAWLLREGSESEAKELVLKISPFFLTLRFYPDNAETPFLVRSVLNNWLDMQNIYNTPYATHIDISTWKLQDSGIGWLTRRRIIFG